MHHLHNIFVQPREAPPHSRTISAMHPHMPHAERRVSACYARLFAAIIRHPQTLPLPAWMCVGVRCAKICFVIDFSWTLFIRRGPKLKMLTMVLGSPSPDDDCWENVIFDAQNTGKKGARDNKESRIAEDPLFDHLSVDSLRVRSFASLKLVDGIVEFLHRERFHCVLVLLGPVLVFVFVRLRR